MKAIAIDDEPIALEIIQSLSAKVPFLNLQASFTDAFEGLEYLQKNHVDLIFLDIKMPDISGVELYKALRNPPLVIFTTAYDDYAVAGFELDAVDYLLKPFSLVRFIKACNKAFELFSIRNSSPQPDFVFVKTGTGQTRVTLDDILYLEASGNYVTFVLKESKVISRLTITEANSNLPADQFIRIHRSFIIAVNKIDRMERHQVTMGDTVIPVGDAYSKNLASFFKNS